MPDLSLPDITLHYEVDGSGPPLLLLAGMLSDSATWVGLTPLLTNHFTVIRPDNRSTGRTGPWDAPISVQQMAADALAVMDHLGHNTFHVAGHSMGGLMAMELTGLPQGRVQTLSILASGRVRSPRTSAIFDALLAIRRAPEGEELWLRALYPWIFGPGFFETPGNVDTALAAALSYPHGQSLEAMAHQMTALKGYRPSVNPAQITCPTLVLYAGQDVMIPPALAKPGFADLPNLTETTIKDAGHSIFWDAPEETANHLRRFALAAQPA